MKKRNEEEPDIQEDNGEELSAEELKELYRLLERLHQADYKALGSININIYKPGSQHVDHVETQHISLTPRSAEGRLHGKNPSSKGEGNRNKPSSDKLAERLKQCITLLMQEKYGNELLFNQQSHWQAVYRVLVDKGYCRDSDFDGFDTFIRMVMPEEVNKPYSKGSVKQISQTDFVRPFEEWKYDALISKTRKPFERMVAVASQFKTILEENGL